MITLRQLQYFLALAELRQFRKAAEKCCVTQPALSMQIKELEESLGVQLVERRHGNLELTEQGQEIASQARAVLNRVHDLEEYSRSSNRILAGPLRLGVIPSVAPYLLPRLLPRVGKQYPDLKLMLHEDLGKVLVRDLLQGTVDAIIVSLPVSDARIETAQLFEDRLLLARPKSADRRKKRSVTLQSIKNEKLLLLNDGHCLRDQALSYCNGHQQTNLSDISVCSLPTILELVAAGYGITLVPEIAASELAEPRIELARFTSPEPRRAIGLCWSKTSSRRRDFEALSVLIHDVLGTAAGLKFHAHAPATRHSRTSSFDMSAVNAKRGSSARAPNGKP